MMQQLENFTGKSNVKCGEVGHRVVESQAKQSKCTLCRSGEHLASQCPIANQDLNYQSPERDDFPEANSMGKGNPPPNLTDLATVFGLLYSI